MATYHCLISGCEKIESESRYEIVVSGRLNGELEGDSALHDKSSGKPSTPRMWSISSQMWDGAGGSA